MSRDRLIRSFRQMEAQGLDRSAPVVTLFSGGLDSTYLLYRLRRDGMTNIHAMSVDLGEDESAAERAHIADRLGARLHVIDGREVFAEEFVRPAIAAHAVYLGTHPVSSSLSRPLIARLAVDLAQRLGSTTILHTANRSQNTLRRLNGALGLLGFGGRYGSPYDLDPVDRSEKIKALTALDLHQMSERLVSGDSNLWCREFESGLLDDPEAHPVPEYLYRWSRTGVDVTEDRIEISFDAGIPKAVDGRELPLTDLIAELNHRTGAFGVGRYSGLEHLRDGEKVLEVREMPAAWLLLRTCRHLEGATLDAETIREKMHLEQVWVREAVEGRWYGDLHKAVQAFIDVCAARVTGSVTWRLTPGGAQTLSIVTPAPLYVRDREEWERGSIRREGAAWAKTPGGPDAAVDWSSGWEPGGVLAT